MERPVSCRLSGDRQVWPSLCKAVAAGKRKDTPPAVTRARALKELLRLPPKRERASQCGGLAVKPAASERAGGRPQLRRPSEPASNDEAGGDERR